MPEVRLTKDVLYFDYVYQGHPIDHSGVLSPAISLDPQYRVSYTKRIEALNRLEQYVDISIIAYRAVAWWATRLGWWRNRQWWNQDVTDRAKEIISHAKKPTVYTVMMSEVRLIR